MGVDHVGWTIGVAGMLPTLSGPASRMWRDERHRRALSDFQSLFEMAWWYRISTIFHGVKAGPPKLEPNLAIAVLYKFRQVALVEFGEF